MIDLLKNRKAQIAAQAIVITGLVGGTGAVVTMNKPVTLAVNGETEEVRSFGGTVGDILDSRDITVGERDEVKPGLDKKIDREMTITVNTAKQVALEVDGKETKEWTTANTVGQALADLGVDAKDAQISAKPDQKLKEDGNDIDVTTAKDLTVLADGKDHSVTAPVDTAEEALNEAGVTLDKDDFLSVPLSATPADGQVLTVNRVKNEVVKEKETIKAKVEKKTSDSLPKGETKVEKKGKDGQKEIEYKVKTVNGEEVKKEKQGEKVLAEAETKIIVEGTKEEAPSTGGGDSGGGSGSGGDSGDSGSGGGDMSTSEIKAMLGGPGSRWYNLVKCESNFNPRASNGTHFGLFQFAQQTWEAMGGSGDPRDASPREQFDRAKKLQAQEGWSQWTCA